MEREQLLGLTTQIVAAYVGNNTVQREHVPGLISDTFASLAGMNRVEPEPEKPTPAVPIKRSVTPDYIICLEDGKQFKSLKRHLTANYRMTPEEYRQKWGLPPDYPMVAPNYAAQRSLLARKIGLGQKPVPAPVEAPPAPPSPPVKASKGHQKAPPIPDSPPAQTGKEKSTKRKSKETIA